MPTFSLQNVLQQMLDSFLRELLATESCKGGSPHERAFQTAHICANAAGEELENIIPQLDLHGVRFFSQDRQARLDVWWLKLGRKSPFKSRNQAVFEICDSRGRAIAGQHDLFVPVEKRIECVKEFLLGPLLAAQKLDVVN